MGITYKRNAQEKHEVKILVRVVESKEKTVKMYEARSKDISESSRK